MFQARIIEKRSRFDLIPIQIYSSTRIIDKTTDRHWKGHREEVQSDGERCTVRKVGEREIQHIPTWGTTIHHRHRAQALITSTKLQLTYHHASRNG